MDQEGETALAERRRQQFLDALPRRVRDVEGALPSILGASNQSPRRRMMRIYEFMDTLAELRAPHVACSKGCSDCCKMNVQISGIEAEMISAATGYPQVRLDASVRHGHEEFLGAPCPFLRGSECSIYEHRPLACRNYASFYTTAAQCAPDVAADKAPQLRFTGIEDSFRAASGGDKRLILADIRDFFPVGFRA